MGKNILSVIMSAALFFILAGCGRVNITGGNRAGEKAADFTLKDLNGNAYSLSNFSGEKAVVIDFTTTWCPYCVSIIPTVKDIYAKYKDMGLEVIAVYLREPKETVANFVKEQGIPYTVLLDESGSVGSAYNVRGVPTLVVVGKDGIIKYVGHGISEDIIDKAIK